MCFKGKPRHYAYYANASRGLSAIAKFLVALAKQNVSVMMYLNYICDTMDASAVNR